MATLTDRPNQAQSAPEKPKAKPAPAPKRKTKPKAAAQKRKSAPAGRGKQAAAARARKSPPAARATTSSAAAPATTALLEAPVQAQAPAPAPPITPPAPPAQPTKPPPARERQIGAPASRRQRVTAMLCLFGPVGGLFLGLVAAAVVALALSLGSGEAPPATGAAELVPANALLYLHISTDPARAAVKRALGVGRQLTDGPVVLASAAARIDAMLSAGANSGGSFAADVRPWLGKEAALAVLDTPGASAGSLTVLDVRNHVAAVRFLATVNARPDGTYRGIPLLAQPSGTALAFVRQYLVLGQVASVRAAIDVAGGRMASLAGSSGYQRAASSEPAGRVIDAYASGDGVRRALVPRVGLLGDLGTLLDEPWLSAATISVSAVGHSLRVDVHRTLSGTPARPGSGQPMAFSPTLAAVMPAHSPLLLDVKGLRASVPKLLSVAAHAGIATRIAPLLSRLGSALAAEGVNLHQILSIFSGETVIGITPAHNGSGPVPVIVTRAADQAHTRAVLAGLEGPLTQVFTPPSSGPGQVPEVNDTAVAGVPVHEVSLAPGFRLVYAVARGLVVVSTAPGGIAAVFRHRTALAAQPSFQALLADRPDQVTSLVFFDLSQLLRLGSRLGLTGSTQQAALWPALEQLRAAGLTSWRGASDTTTELQLHIP